MGNFRHLGRDGLRVRTSFGGEECGERCCKTGRDAGLSCSLVGSESWRGLQEMGRAVGVHAYRDVERHGTGTVTSRARRGSYDRNEDTKVSIK